MKKKALLVILLIILISVDAAGAQEIIEYSAHIDVDRTSLIEKVSITISNNHEAVLRKLTYPFSSQVQNLKTFDDLGGLESEVKLLGGKNYVTTELRNSLGFEDNATVLYEFEDPSSVTFFNGTYVLSTSFPLLANVKRFDLSLRLPEGTGLRDPSVDVVPAPTEITSDGRAVILKWTASNPIEFRIFVRYEHLPAATTTTIETTTTTQPVTGYSEKALLGLSLLMLLIFVALFLLKLRPQTDIDEKIEILKEDEQLILKLVAEKDGVEQREIQRETDFSKTKVSKILSELEKRGVIRKESFGKKNKVYLTQKLKE